MTLPLCQTSSTAPGISASWMASNTIPSRTLKRAEGLAAFLDAPESGAHNKHTTAISWRPKRRVYEFEGVALMLRLYTSSGTYLKKFEPVCRVRKCPLFIFCYDLS